MDYLATLVTRNGENHLKMQLSAHWGQDVSERDKQFDYNFNDNMNMIKISITCFTKRQNFPLSCRYFKYFDLKYLHRHIQRAKTKTLSKDRKSQVIFSPIIGGGEGHIYCKGLLHVAAQCFFPLFCSWLSCFTAECLTTVFLLRTVLLSSVHLSMKVLRCYGLINMSREPPNSILCSFLPRKWVSEIIGRKECLVVSHSIRLSPPKKLPYF